MIASMTSRIMVRQIQRIKEELRKEPMDVTTLAENVYRTPRSVRDYINYLHDTERTIYIKRWQENRAHRGKLVPVYALKKTGKEKDAKP